MNPTAPRSLRSRLLLWLVGVLSTIWLTALCLVLWNASGEVREAYNGQVIHFARAMATINSANGLGVLPETDPNWRDGFNNYFVVVLRDGEEVYRSPNTPAEFSSETGSGPLETDLGDWTLATRTSQDGSATATIGLHDGDVTYYAWGMVAGVAIPMLIGFAAIVLGIVLGVTHGLRPLTQLGHQILGRSSRQLHPVSIENAPAELLPIISSLNGLFHRLTVSLDKERRFIADASHELRTPLTAIKAQLQTIDRRSVDHEVLETLEKMGTGLDRAARLIEQLLAMARSEDANLDRPTTQVDLDGVARQELAESFQRALTANVELRFEGSGACVQGNATELGILVRNLVDNAIVYAGAGSSVSISTGVTEGWAWFQVEDSGAGISESELTKVFDRFTRGSNVEGQGSGLGLSIVRAIAHRHGGEVTLKRSTILGGLCARVMLPIAPPRHASRDL